MKFLKEQIHIVSIFIKTVQSSHWNYAKPTASFEEHGLKLNSLIEGGQKTGYFLDQRDNRLLVSQLTLHPLRNFFFRIILRVQISSTGTLQHLSAIWCSEFLPTILPPATKRSALRMAASWVLVPQLRLQHSQFKATPTSTRLSSPSAPPQQQRLL